MTSGVMYVAFLESVTVGFMCNIQL